MAWGGILGSKSGYSGEASLDESLLVSGATTSAASAPSLASALSTIGPIMGIFGALQTGVGSYFQAKSAASNLQFQADMAAINARMAENTAQSILDAGQKEAGRISLKAGNVKSAQKADQGHRGIVIGEGSGAEQLATTDLMKEIDMYTVNANATRQAWAARTQSVNAANESLLKGTMASGISPFMAASSSLLTSGSAVASSWYSSRKLNRLASVLGVD